VASLAKENSGFRIHWKFTIKAGPRADEEIRGILSLGRCTRAIAKTHLSFPESPSGRLGRQG